MILLLLVIFILGTKGFGLLGYKAASVISTPIGTLELNQILLIAAFVICFLNSKRRRINVRDSILFPLFFLILFVLFQFFRNYIEGLDLQLAMRGIKRIYMIFYIFPLIILIKSRSQLQTFINYILLIGLLSSLVSIYQFITGTTFGISTASVFTRGFSRIYHPGAVLIVFCFFISLSHFLTFGIKKRYNWMYVIIPFYIIGILTTLHRSLIGTTIICSVIMIFLYLFYVKKIKSIWKTILGSLILILALNYFFHMIGFGVEPLLLRGESAVMEIKYFEGNYADRWEILINTFSRIMIESPLIGVGYKYKSDANVLVTFYLTNDSTYNNILVMFGLIGFIVWFILLYKIAIISKSNYKSILKLSDKALYLAILVMPLFFIVIGLFNSLFTYSANLTVVITIIGILYLLNYFQMQTQAGANKK